MKSGCFYDYSFFEINVTMNAHHLQEEEKDNYV